VVAGAPTPLALRTTRASGVVSISVSFLFHFCLVSPWIAPVSQMICKKILHQSIGDLSGGGTASTISTQIPAGVRFNNTVNTVISRCSFAVRRNASNSPLLVIPLPISHQMIKWPLTSETQIHPKCTGSW